MEDYLVKALAVHDEIRAYCVCGTHLVKEAQERHDTYNGATIALGRTLLGALLVGGTLKGEDKITVKVQGDGPLGAIIVDSNGTGTVKGYVQHPHCYIQPDENLQPSIPDTVGKGVLTVIKDLGLKEPFSGQVPLIKGDISQDFTYYMAVSEQIPTAMSLSVLLDEEGQVRAAGGFMIQVLPNASEESIAKVEESLKQIQHFSKGIAEGKEPEVLLTEILGPSVEVLEKTPVKFLCDCSKEKFATAIIALGSQEIEDMIVEDHGAEAVCSFCNTHYHYTEEDLKALKQEAES